MLFRRIEIITVLHRHQAEAHIVKAKPCSTLTASCMVLEVFHHGKIVFLHWGTAFKTLSF